MFRQPEQQNIKITYNDRYLFDMTFKTQLCLSLTVVDRVMSKKYQNKNVEFKKTTKNIIIAALEKKKPYEIKCFVKETSEKKQSKQKQEDQMNMKNSLIIEFTVDTVFIHPFSETVILTQIDSKSSIQLIPEKISAHKISQIKTLIQKIDKSLPQKLNHSEQEQDQKLRIFEQQSMSIKKQQHQQTLQYYYLIGTNVFLILLFILYLSFFEYLQLLVLLWLGWWMYFRSQKFHIQSITLKKGYYKIDIYGAISVQNYNNANNSDSFLIYAWFNYRHYQQLKMHVRSLYTYGYPFSACFLVESEKEQEIKIMIQKNVKINPVNLANLLITVEKIPKISF